MIFISSRPRRPSLTRTAQEAEKIAARKEKYEALHPETKAGVAQAVSMNRKLGNNVTDNLSATFTAEAAAKTGLDERTIRRAAGRQYYQPMPTPTRGRGERDFISV